MPKILGFSAAIGVGKTSLSVEVAKQLSWQHVSFSDYLRAVAAASNVEATRANLQSLGEAEIAKGWEQFCRAVLAHVGWDGDRPVVMDGVRHADAVRTLRCIAYPSPFFLVFITLSDTERERRLSERGEVISPTIASHSTEREVGTVLPALCDLCIDGHLPLIEQAKAVMNAVTQHR